MNISPLLLGVLVLTQCSLCVVLAGSGTLRVHPDNPRYFTDDSGKALFLTGSHVWNNFVDMGPGDPPEPLDYEAHFDWLKSLNHNFVRLWAWELLTWDTSSYDKGTPSVFHVTPHPWKRTGPGLARDGKPRFDLNTIDEGFLMRLQERVRAAQERGLFVSVMLFEGWGVQMDPGGWTSHPFHPDNHINDIEVDRNGDGRGVEMHDGSNRAVTEIQRNYVRHVIDAINDFDNVLYEISNENHAASTEWQYAMIRYIRHYEATKPKRHPVGMTFQHKGGTNEALFNSPADWISPNKDGGYRDDPPIADGSKVIIADTDHLWGIGGNPEWVWKSFLRGINPIFMDPIDGSILKRGYIPEDAEAIRKAMGYALAWSKRVNLAAMHPRQELSSRRYCLADEGKEYLVFSTASEPSFTLTLPEGNYEAVWSNTSQGLEGDPFLFHHTGASREFQSPFDSNSLLHIRSKE